MNVEFERKSGNEADDKTAFLREDRDYGGKFEDRPPTLFQIDPPKNRNTAKPNDFVRFQGRVLLDPFDHGIRDFPGELPPCLSTNVEGWEIEHYKRRNSQINTYDLMGKQSNS